MLTPSRRASAALVARSGGRILIDQLVAQGVDRVSCVPGESYLAALDALYDSGVDVVICPPDWSLAPSVTTSTCEGPGFPPPKSA